MKTKEELQKQINDLESELQPLKDELRELRNQTEKEAQARVLGCNQLTDKFNPDELVFAAYEKCPCGAGMAYPKEIGAHGSWDCSAILLGEADVAVKHQASLPFAFYEIKSENQPSVNGATTRINP